MYMDHRTKKEKGIQETETQFNVSPVSGPDCLLQEVAGPDMQNISEGWGNKAFLPRQRKVLVMDDDELFTLVVSRMLTELGYAVETVNDGKKAVDIYNREKDSDRPFDAVILDLKVPGGMGGTETLRRLYEIDINVKAIISSGARWEEVMRGYRSFGFSAALCKPFSLEELAEAVRAAIIS